ncbi:MAG: response regulator [Gemmatimonadetes bacterium]|nr:response regulator [Gemmatimonadota bacterium]
MHGRHHLDLVLVAWLIATVAAIAALAVVDRIRATRATPARAFWLAAGAWSTGTGIWAAHFVGMVSWHLPIPVAFSARTTLLSVVPAVVASGIALVVLSAPRMRRGGTALGSLLMASGISATQFTGMAAIRANADLYYDPTLFAASLAVATVLATAALSMRHALQRASTPSLGMRVLRAGVLGSAVIAMHYTAMASVRVFERATPYSPTGVLPDSTLAVLVSTAVAFVVGTTVLGTLVDRRIAGMSMELAAREARFKAVLYAMADGVVTFDEAGTIESANVAAAQMFGVEVDALVGRSVALLIPDACDGPFAGRDGNAASDPALGARREMTAHRASGEAFPIELVISEVALEERTIYSGVIRDITARVESEQRLHQHVRELEEARNALQAQAERLSVARDRAEQGARAKSEFLATMSHELRTPMNGVLGMAQLLLHTPLNDEQAARVHMLRKSGEALLRIINDVLDFSKIEAGKLSIESHPFDVHGILEEVRETLNSAADVVGLSLTVHVEASCPRHVMGDAGRVRQVLFNLVGNAIKFTDRGRVSIVARGSGTQQDPTVWIDVQDTGIGMSTETVARLFAPFTQADGSATRRHGGTGLGLAISRRLAEMMGGTITVASTLGEGSCFTLALPLPAASARERGSGGAAWGAFASAGVDRQETTVAETDGRGIRVLVAEDNMVNQIVAVSLLAHLGCTVDVASDGREAVQRWSDGVYDLIFMDIQMPEMDGLEATRHIRAAEDATHRVPIVALTANAMHEDRGVCLEAGMDEHIAKPVTEEALLGALALARRPCAVGERR